MTAWRTRLLVSEAELNRVAVRILKEALSHQDPAVQFQVLQQRVRELPQEYDGVQTLLAAQETMMNALNTERERHEDRKDKRFSAVVGVVFLLVAIGLAVAFPEPTASQTRTFCLIQSAAAGGAIGFLTGTISFNGERANARVRATGAIAVAVMFYFWC